ncbi:hypothetical protein [Planomonospora sp. ID82291]|uniref:hypothetical protein n=1 Tax=Planomonospora sp. ID82291 TaxID=2738136 RepID=UPI0018C43259|nr:hypothetical protein [Planomonospora sp. ID82291]MBG0818730.1 hypothetical protein [Planomonospora sp. ID82291]
MPTLIAPPQRCSSCDGAGQHAYAVLPDDDSFTLTCWTCKGHGSYRDWSARTTAVLNFAAALVMVILLALLAAVAAGLPVLADLNNLLSLSWAVR